MPDRYTLPGTRLPEGALPPTLLFHRWQAYDRFELEKELDRDGRQRRDRKTGELKWLEPFVRQEANLRFLRKVAEDVQSFGRPYKDWYDRFIDACEKLGAEPPVSATTLWRLAVGWGTNPAFETGLTLDHLLGFPYIPGSAVKGLLHRVAEQELLEDHNGVPIPPAPDALPDAPPANLMDALSRCRRVRALFGSLHLRRNQESDPEAPFNRLAAWRDRLPEPGQEREPWTEARHQLARLCSDTPAGGMVTCFDAVPIPEAFSDKREILTPDVLTPHKDNKPIPIPFLAVRDGVTFELRYRLAWPASKPRDREEEERASDLDGIDQTTVATELKRLLVRGLAELGLGGKTSAGYGYLLAEGVWLPMPTLLEEQPASVEPKEPISEAEQFARSVLYDGIKGDQAVDALDKVLKEAEPAKQAAVVARFIKLFPGNLEKWRASQRLPTMRRAAAMDRLLGERQEDKP